MNKLMCLLLLVVGVLFLSVPVFAQGGGTAAPIDLYAIFGDVASLAAAIVVLVQFVRAHVWTALDGKLLVGSVFVLGVVLGVAGFYLHLTPVTITTVYEAVGYGFSAALTAIGGVNLLKTVASKAVTIANK